jgi:hypothetical protein
LSTDGSLSVAKSASVTENLTVNGNTTLGDNASDVIGITGATTVTGTTIITGATTVTGNTSINASGSGTTTIGSAANGGAVSIASSGVNNITVNPGGDLVLQNIDTDASPTQMLTLTAGGSVRATDLVGTADQGVSYTNGKYQLGSTATSGVGSVPLTQNRYVNASDFTLDFTYNDAGTARSMFRLNDGEVTVTAPSNFRVVAPTIIKGNTQINPAAADGSTSIGNSSSAFTLVSNNLNISNVGVISDAAGDVEVNDNLYVNGTATVTSNLSVGGQIKGAGLERNNSASASNKFAERVVVSGSGTYVYTITNSQVTANSVVIVTLEDYTGPGILSYQIKRPKDGGGNVIPGSFDVYFSQPILGGESVVVNVMVINN